MAEKLFPTRKRCKACSKKLDTLVLSQLYCSYACAGHPEPFVKPEEAPRQCRVEREGKWQWKKRYRTENEVPVAIQNDPSTNIYPCSHCLNFHIGHERAMGTETARLVRDRETLSSVLIRIRESKNLTRKDVAEKIKTRPIRIKEIEENTAPADMKVLFDMLYFYKVKMNLLL